MRPQRVGSTRPRHEFTSPSSPTSCCGARHIRGDQTSWLYFCAITLGGWRPISKDYLTMTKNQTEVRFQSFTSFPPPPFSSFAITFLPWNAASTWKMCGYGVFMSICPCQAWKPELFNMRPKINEDGKRSCVYLQSVENVCVSPGLLMLIHPLSQPQLISW